MQKSIYYAPVMALNRLYCADVPLNYSLTYAPVGNEHDPTIAARNYRPSTAHLLHKCEVARFDGTLYNATSFTKQEVSIGLIKP